ncbi:Bug family tripartite tricarboxylate transporter substrate binding protein [Cetobacterium sp. SF1]|uniref:Bug family tripartite tricarboxylate transporter substrate binding protein n=1 Tax=Cetobacterium sp. SF1 TaxID=3417654 RepID=UPI003CFA0A4D
MSIKKILIVILIFLIGLLGYNRYLYKKKVQNYPQKPLNLIVGFKKGGGTDISANFLKEVMKNNLTLNIINIPGDNGILGLKKFLEEDNDGYNLVLFNYPSFYYLNELKKYNINREDYEILFSYVYDPGVLIVNKNSDIKNYKDFIEKSKNFDFTIGENGIGASDYILAKMLAKKLKILPKYISFSSSSQMLEALEYGYIDSAILKESEIIDSIKNDKIRAIMAFSNKKLTFLEDIPLGKDMGCNLNMGSIRGIAIKKNTPFYIKNYLRKVFKERLEEEDVIELAKKYNIPFYYLDGEKVNKYIENKNIEINNNIF